MNIKDQIIAFLRSTPVYSSSLPSQLTDDLPLIEAGILDSIGLFSLVIFIEKTFSVQIEITELIESNFGNLNLIEAFLKKKSSFQASR